MTRRGPTDADPNPNTAWLHHRAMRYVYLYLLVATWVFFRMFMPSSALCLTMTVQAHAIATFFLFHWVKGTLGGGALNADYAHQTFWEQIDSGFYGTPARRFLVLVPIVLFFVALVANGEDLTALALNFLSTMLILVPKHESLTDVRFFGINKLNEE
jgi:hypothetical protein